MVDERQSEIVIPQETAEEKVRRVFSPYVVRKELLQSQEISRLPRFISEYLMSKFFSNNNEPSQEEMKKLSDFVAVHFPEMRDRDKILHDIMTSGTYTFMDEFKVETDIKAATHRLIIPCLNIRDAKILSTILDENVDLLRSGMWGIATAKYVPEEGDGRGAKGRGGPTETSPILMTKFTPFEVVNVRLSDFASKRKEFSTREWIELLITSVGLNPSAYSEHQRLLLLSRLVPLVEANSNLLEIGPKATGKTYLYRNISYSTRLISGGRVSPAVLFYNISTKAVGEIGIRDCVVLDEMNKLAFVNAEEMVGKLKDYLVDGFFERGPKKANAKASIVFMGNMEFRGSSWTTVAPEPHEVINALPAFMRDSAMLDRIHCFVPGWELPKILQSSEHLARGYGIVADYLSELFHQMSLTSFTDIINERVTLEGSGNASVTIRDEKAIRKLASGMLKLLCPDRNCSDADLSLCMDMAVEGRRGVNDLLHSLSPNEFEQKRFSYSLGMPRIS
ncbi:MAG: BREX system Lon protease-like protein BrxL [Thaumarchaeota archaeon]|nr:MAG: BREX system Lon protease-like protein BrxL [Nitrososphaerota archaeon]